MQNGTATCGPPTARDRSSGDAPGSSGGGGSSGGTNGTDVISNGSGKEIEQQVSAEHEALAAKLNELGGLVAKFGVALPQVLTQLCPKPLITFTAHDSVQ